MSNPVNVLLPVKNTWYKVASSVMSGTIDILKYPSADYVYTYKVADDPAPVDLSDDINCEVNQLVIVNDAPIDVYMRCVNDNGSVEVSL